MSAWIACCRSSVGGLSKKIGANYRPVTWATIRSVPTSNECRDHEHIKRKYRGAADCHNNLQMPKLLKIQVVECLNNLQQSEICDRGTHGEVAIARLSCATCWSTPAVIGEMIACRNESGKSVDDHTQELKCYHFSDNGRLGPVTLVLPIYS